ncbi:MAG: LysR family transcriptional regulator, partial [Rhodanobacter sp.]
MQDLLDFLAVLQAGGLREAARTGNGSASQLSDSVKRLETRLGVRLLHRITRSVSATEAGQRLAERLTPALAEVQASLDVVNHFRDRPAGTLRINVPANVARTVLPPIVTPFLKRYPEIRLEVIVEDSLVDLLATG